MTATQEHLNCFGHDMSLMAKPVAAPTSLDGLLDMLDNDGEHDGVVWRDQPNTMWAPFPTLIRRLRASGFSDTQINESMIQAVEAGLIKDAKSQSLIGEDGGSVVEFMARMQHYGGATRFLDVTSNPLAALYFASGGDPRVAGVVFRYRINPERVCRLEK